MSNENADELSSAGEPTANDDLRGLVEDLASEVEDLREQNAQLHERVDEVEAENEDLRERVEELSDDVSEEVDRLAREQAQTNGRLTSLEESIEATEAVENGEVDVDEDATPMEQIVALPEHVAAEQFDNAQHRNTYRARSLVRDFFDYAEKTPKGHIVWNRDLIRVLSAQEDGRIESKTGERVMKRVEELSKGAFDHVEPGETRKQQHALVLENPDELPSLGGGTVVS